MMRVLRWVDTTDLGYLTYLVVTASLVWLIWRGYLKVREMRRLRMLKVIEKREEQQLRDAVPKPEEADDLARTGMFDVLVNGAFVADVTAVDFQRYDDGTLDIHMCQSVRKGQRGLYDIVMSAMVHTNTKTMEPSQVYEASIAVRAKGGSVVALLSLKAPRVLRSWDDLDVEEIEAWREVTVFEDCQVTVDRPTYSEVIGGTR